MKVHGVFAPLTTPFDRDESLDLHGLARNLQGYGAAPLAGYVVAGTTGEGPQLSDLECEQLVGAAVAAAGGRPVIAQIGREAVRPTVEMAARAQAAGAAAVLVLPPRYYAHRLDAVAAAAAVADFYIAVADAAALSMFVYHIPQHTGVRLDPASVARLAAHPRIVGMKDSEGHRERLAAFASAAPPGWGLLCGSGALVAEAARLGVAGAVLGEADVLPFEMCDLWRLAVDGPPQAADGLRSRLEPVRRVLGRTGIAGIKYAMDLLGFCGGRPRRPLPPLPAAEGAQLADALREAGCIRF